MSIEQNKASARRLTEEAWSGNFTVLDDVVAPGFVGHQPGGGTIAGRAAYKEFVANFHKGLPDFRVTVEDQIAEGDRVATRWSAVGTHLGTYLGRAPTGKEILITGTSTARFVDGKHVEHWSNWDAPGLPQQCGIFPRWSRRTKQRRGRGHARDATDVGQRPPSRSRVCDGQPGLGRSWQDAL
jgi:predicted ester cyclase